MVYLGIGGGSEREGEDLPDGREFHEADIHGVTRNGELEVAEDAEGLSHPAPGDVLGHGAVGDPGIGPELLGQLHPFLLEGVAKLGVDVEEGR